MTPTSVVQEVGSLRVYGQWVSVGVIESCKIVLLWS